MSETGQILARLDDFRTTVEDMRRDLNENTKALASLETATFQIGAGHSRLRSDFDELRPKVDELLARRPDAGRWQVRAALILAAGAVVAAAKPWTWIHPPPAAAIEQHEGK